MASEGYGETINVDGGLDGRRNMLGSLVAEGWQSAGLPTSTENGDGVSYESLKAKTDPS